MSPRYHSKTSIMVKSFPVTNFFKLNALFYLHECQSIVYKYFFKNLISQIHFLNPRELNCFLWTTN